MTQPVHTPGPAQLPTGFESVKPDEHEGLPLLANCDPSNAIAFVVPRKECNANARLLAAAYNAFDSAAKKLGCNAVELAERMQEGEVAALVESLRDVLSRFHSCIADGNGKIEGDEAALARAGKILDRVKGGAA